MAPNEDECALSFQEILPTRPVHLYFPCLLSEFRDQHVVWEEILPDAPKPRLSPLLYAMYLWPLQRVKQHTGGTLFVRAPFSYEKQTQRKESERTNV